MKRLFVLVAFLGALASLSAQEALSESQVTPGGAYPAPLSVEVQAPAGSRVVYRFLEIPGSVTFPWVQPLVLDALPGETRVYRLRLTTDLATGETITRDYRYQVSRPAPRVATVQPEPGRYGAAITVKADLPPGWSALENGRRVTFPRVIDARPGTVTETSLVVLGPSGETLQWHYTVDRQDQESVGLDVMSPLPGDWANPQTLVVAFRGVDRVLWSYGDKIDPNAQEYGGPVLLDRTGPQTVTIAARSRTDGRWVTKTVGWTNGTSPAPLEGWPRSGVYVTGLTIPALAGYSLSWDEGRSWEPRSTPWTEAPSTTSRKVLTVQLKKEGSLYRYIYWLDARAPQDPMVEFFGGWNPRVVFVGAVEAVHRITWTRANGQAVEDPGVLWGPLGSWKVPDGMVAARVTVQGTNGRTGSQVTLGFPETGWSTPSWEPWDQSGPQIDSGSLPRGGRILPRPGFLPVYEVSDRSEVAEPGPTSPWLEGGFFPTVPWGDDRTLYVRFAWRDAGGLVGPSTPVIAVRIDHVPPLTPEVVSTGSQILVKPAEGNEGDALFWAVTTTRVASLDAVTLQPYQQPLNLAGLQNGASGPLWFHALAQDKAGNSGPARLNVALTSGTDRGHSVVQVDPDPAIGETTVEDQGIYPWSTFRLRSLEASADLWVGVADQALTVPTDWKTRLQPWTSVVTRSVARGERKSFLVYWNTKKDADWLWPQPKTLVLTLDQSAPLAPRVDPWPSAPLGSAWTLGANPTRSGDRIVYTFTLDGTTPPDPLVSGEPWPGTKTWDSPLGLRTVVRVRMATVSVSGVGLETPLGGPVVIDRSPVPAVVPALDSFTYRTSATVVKVPADALVRYTLTTDGRLPDVPTAASPLVPSNGLSLEGKPGLSTLYRFRWRTFSGAGLPGPATDVYGVLIDLTGAPSPTKESSVVAPQTASVLGVPASGMSSQPVILDSASPGLRFEMTEGRGTPLSVTAHSASWVGPLTLDPGPGVDRDYAVSVRAFSPDGSPASPEVTYRVRVDRSPPSSPDLELLPDSRRPEVVLRYHSGGPTLEETLYYRWSWSAFPEGEGQSEWKTFGSDPAVFSAPGGALTRLNMEAFWKDQVGNAGPIVSKSVLIDQNVVYLSPAATGLGTRENPSGNAADALTRARREGKSIVLALAGSYTVSRTLDLSGMRVYGGLAPGLWEASPSPARSVLAASVPFAGRALVETEGRACLLSSVDLVSSVPLDQVVAAKNSSVVVKNGTWTWSGAHRGWDQEGGSLDWTNVTAAYTALPQGTFLDARSLEASIRGLRLSAVQNDGGLLVSLVGSAALVQNLVLVSKESLGLDGIWASTDSKLTLDQARIQAGDGADRATAFLLTRTEATLWNTEIALYGNLANTGFQVSGGRLELQKASLALLRGREFNQGLILDAVDTVLQGLDLSIESGAYQGGLSVDGGSLRWTLGTVRVNGGGQRAWGAQFLSTTLVGFEDITWTLTNPTPHDLWKKEQPWASGSQTTNQKQTGW